MALIEEFVVYSHEDIMLSAGNVVRPQFRTIHEV